VTRMMLSTGCQRRLRTDGGMAGFRTGAPNFRRSSKCSAAECVEVAIDPSSGTVLVRNSQGGHELSFGPREWSVFVTGIKHGEFDVPQDFPRDLLPADVT
jgi:Domain of unknown function (DUF397)